MRSARIFAIGTVALLAALCIEFWAKWATLAVAVLPLLLLVTGQFFLPESKKCIRLWMNPDLLEHFAEISMRLSGREVTLDFFRRWYEFEIEVCRMWALTILGLASVGATAGVWTTHELPMPGYNFWYFGGSAWLTVCYFAWRWLWERKVMRKAELALGSFRITGMEGPLIKRVSYHFIDNRGEYRGGSLRTLFCDAQDDLTVIFYDEENPEQSVPASAMMFHKLRWLKV